MSEDFKTYLDKIKFEKYLDKLKKKLKNKTVVIYGTGSFYRYIKENYDLSFLNVVGISDMKFAEDQEGEEYLGYKVVPKCKIKDLNPDYVIVATLKYIGIIENFELDFYKTKIKVIPLARIPFWDLVKEIWEK